MSAHANEAAAREDRSPAREARPTGWRRVRSSPLFHLAVVLVLLSLVHGFVVKPYRVPSGSMEQTLEVGDRIYANRLAYLGGGPERGDVVVFVKPESWGDVPHYTGFRAIIGAIGDVIGFGASNQEALVKRVVGLPGDRVSCCDVAGHLMVNGEPLDEPYIFEDYPFEAGALDCESVPASMRCFREIELGEDQYLMLGDHRSRSADAVIGCRSAAGPALTPPGCARIVSREDLVGEVAFRIWPLTRVGGVG